MYYDDEWNEVDAAPTSDKHAAVRQGTVPWHIYLTIVLVISGYTFWAFLLLWIHLMHMMDAPHRHEKNREKRMMRRFRRDRRNVRNPPLADRGNDKLLRYRASRGVGYSRGADRMTKEKGEARELGEELDEKRELAEEDDRMEKVKIADGEETSRSKMLKNQIRIDRAKARKNAADKEVDAEIKKDQPKQEPARLE